MKPKTPTAVYRPILREAWRLAWERKRLWVFGILAGILSTGGVVEVLIRSFRQIEMTGGFLSRLLSGSFLGGETFGLYVGQLLLLDRARVTVTGTILMLLALLILIVAIRSQASLISGLFSHRVPSASEAWQAGRGHFWSILALNILTRAVHVLVVIITALPLVLFLSNSTIGNALLFFFLFLVFFPLTIITSFVSTLALIHLVRERLGLIHAIQAAFHLLARHWLAAFELGFILFVLVSLGGLAFLSILVILAVPYSILITLALLTSLQTVFTVVLGIGAIALGTLFLAFAGAMVTFQHAAWVGFYRRMTHRVQAGSLLAKLERLWQKI
jgi:hypothetical protein